MSTFLDDDLAAILRLRWQLVDGEETGAAALPYNAAWSRSQLVSEILDLFYDETKFGHVAGLVAPGELDGIGTLRTAAARHYDAMASVMNAGE
ncbi:MAG: hypothetical protein ABIR17_13020 [Pseudolysinimonas sp.]|uniref:hypothetical protein n=1 Tax=Pseudolysinimonas sp. TaxID=2680009 RepID=UPI00326567DF